MKTIAKTSYIIATSFLVLSSCGQEDVAGSLPDGKDRRIVFSASVPELTTKAVAIAKDLEYFRLTVFDETDPDLVKDGKLAEYVDNIQLKKDAGVERFASHLCVWPNPDLGHEEDILHFFAYYPELNSDAVTENTTTASGNGKTAGYKVKGFQVARDIADQVDFVTAYATGSMVKDYYKGVDLKFKHQLSRIQVEAKGVHKSCDIEIAGICISNAIISGSFAFQTSDAYGTWTDVSKGNAEYVFRAGDAIVSVGSTPVSVMGKKIDDDNDGCAMLIPSTTLTAWAFDKDAKNENKGLYLNVLLRIIDKTNTSGKGQQRYPYTDNSQGLNSPNIPRVYFAVRSNGVVASRLYKKDDVYYSDAECTEPYSLQRNETVKEFGWAAVPVSGSWEPGKIYTYTLDYTYGVGVHGPETPGDVAPMAGDPIISDRVGVSLGFKDWQTSNPVGVTVPDK